MCAGPPATNRNTRQLFELAGVSILDARADAKRPGTIWVPPEIKLEQKPERWRRSHISLWHNSAIDVRPCECRQTQEEANLNDETGAAALA